MEICLADAVAIVRHVLADRLGFALDDESTHSRLDEAARDLVLARGPEGSADVITVLAIQLAMHMVRLAGPAGDPEALFTALIRSTVDASREQQRAEHDRRGQGR